MTDDHINIFYNDEDGGELPRAELVRRAVERFLDDIEDIALAQELLADLADPVLSWSDVRGELLGD